MTTYGTAEDFLSAEPETEEVSLRGKTYIVRGLTGKERERWESALVTQKGGNLVPNMQGRALARLVMMSVIDGTGKRIFRDAQLDQIADLPSVDLSRIADVCKRLSGIGEADIEELAGNSESDQSDSSSSSSPSLSVAPSASSSTPSRVAN
jgi:hypothetical protein